MKIDEIYDELVKVRDKMAKKLGYKNYVELGYARLTRTDYNAEMVATYRKQVLEDLVPVSAKTIKKTSKTFRVNSLKIL